jgi:soluble lytic murein transglycosylase
MLYSIGERELAPQFVTALAETSTDVRTLVAHAEITTRYYFTAIGPEIEPSIVYSVVRTESGFDPRDVSPANAVGLMQPVRLDPPPLRELAISATPASETTPTSGKQRS